MTTPDVERRAQREWDDTFVIESEDFILAFNDLLKQCVERNLSLAQVCRRLHVRRNNVYIWRAKAPSNLLLRRALITSLNRLVSI